MEKESVALLGICMGTMERILQNIIESYSKKYIFSVKLFFQSGAYTKIVDPFGSILRCALSLY